MINLQNNKHSFTTSPSAESPYRRFNPVVILIVVYIWILMVKPENRFTFLQVIHFERLVMIIAWLTLFLTHRMRIRFSSTTFVMFCLYLAMLVSYLASPFQDYEGARHWFENYWKLIVLYFLIFFAIDDVKDI